jgi:hypothetical protein
LVIAHFAALRRSLYTFESFVLLRQEFHAETLADGLAFVGVHVHWSSVAKAICTNEES